MSGDTYDAMVLRLKTVAFHKAKSGMAVMRLALVFIDGELQLWSEPEVCRYDPGNEDNERAAKARQALILALTRGQ